MCAFLTNNIFLFFGIMCIYVIGVSLTANAKNAF